MPKLKINIEVDICIEELKRRNQTIDEYIENIDICEYGNNGGVVISNCDDLGDDDYEYETMYNPEIKSIEFIK